MSRSAPPRTQRQAGAILASTPVLASRGTPAAGPRRPGPLTRLPLPRADAAKARSRGARPTRIPPWLPTSPPKKPESAPAKRRTEGALGSGTGRRMISVIPATSMSTPSTAVRSPLRTVVWSRAPISPPTTLAMPNCRKTGRSTSPRSLSHRATLASAWGTATSATASCAGNQSRRSGVTRLPIPNPETAATEPASRPIEATRPSNCTDGSTERTIPARVEERVDLSVELSSVSA